MDLYQNFKITRVSKGKSKQTEDPVIIEFPLEIFVNKEKIVTLICSPEYMEDLAAGYLFSEGLYNNINDLKEIKLAENKIYIRLSHNITEGINFNHRIITSGCGRSTVFTDLNGTGLKKVRTDVVVHINEIYDAVGELFRQAEIFRKTGGVHNSLLRDIETYELLFREDIGRHNAVDKIIGSIILNEMKTGSKMLVISGRISSEILLKTARARIPFLVSPSAPTDRAIQLAYRLGICLCGFVRGSRMNIYTYQERILFD